MNLFTPIERQAIRDTMLLIEGLVIWMGAVYAGIINY